MSGTFPICPCDDLTPPAPTNLSELPAISYRVGTYASFRQAVLTPLMAPGNPAPVPVEQTLSVNGVPVWRTDGAGDLAVMVAEWFAYIGDVITFYNEGIANESFLRTAVLPASVNNLIGVLGYRPQPAIGATGTLAALVSPGPSFGAPITLPTGLQFQSKPTPGLPPQIFELAQATQISAPDQFPATPPPELLGEVTTLVATYRMGAGAASPPAGTLTVIANPYPGLRAVLNPLAVGGGADPAQPSQIRRDAPRSVLTFGRAVSVFDYAAIAAQAPGVTRANAVWGWDDAIQRALVRVYVGDTPAAAISACQALSAASDPNRPVKVTQATEFDVALGLTLIYTPGIDTDQLTQAVQTALADTEVGLFGAWNLNVGQTVFVSQIEAAVLAVSGAVALTALRFYANGTRLAGPIFNPGENGYFALDPGNINLSLEPDSNG